MPWVVREAVRDINRAVARRWHAIDPLLPDPSTLPSKFAWLGEIVSPKENGVVVPARAAYSHSASDSRR